MELSILNSIDPFLEERADWRNAQLCALLYNVNRQNKNDKVAEVSDFLYPEPILELESDKSESFSLQEKIKQALRR